MTLFPALIEPVRSEGLLGKAVETGLVAVHAHNFRDFATDKHRTVDDVPYGGGAGMVIKPEPVAACLTALRPQLADGTKVVLLSPAGRPFRQQDAKDWARLPGMVLLCGRYEGFDARIEALCDEVVSIGDYVLNGGEVAALAIVEAVGRLLAGVVGNAASLHEESHSSGLLEHPHYTRPRQFEGAEVPEVLLGGNHAEIARWRRRQSLLRTAERRPDLLENADMQATDLAWLAEQGQNPVDKIAKIRIFAALVHHPVLDKTGQVVTTALTNVDLHDLARSAKTYGLQAVFVVTPVPLQQQMVAEVAQHWTHGQGSGHRKRAAAMHLIQVAASVEQARDEIEKTTGCAPVVAVTAARPSDDQAQQAWTFGQCRQFIRSGATENRPLLLVFGTGWGLAPQALALGNVRLPPIVRDPQIAGEPYNHLSVRAAAAIVFDRLLGQADG